MNIGIVIYTKYEERVLLNEHFVIEDLFAIVQHDREYREFQIVDGKGQLLLSTDYRENEQEVEHLIMARIEKEYDVIGIEYYAFRRPSTKRKYKVTWKVNGGICRGKKDAEQYAGRMNGRARLILERYIERKGS